MPGDPFDRPNVVFVCLGNICRSPVALALYEELGASAGPAKSRALEKWNVGAGADRVMCDVAEARGVDLSNHRAAQLSDTDEAWADVLVVMEPHHRDALIQRFGERVASKIMLLDPGVAIADPYGLGLQAAHRAFDHIQRSVQTLPHRLQGIRRQT